MRDSQDNSDRSLQKRGLRLLIGGFAEKAGLWRMRGWAKPGDYFRFLSLHPHRLGFCLLWVATSGFGQTYFLSLFQPVWIDKLQLSTTAMGSLYGGATLLSASLLGRIGIWVDRTPVKWIGAVTAAGLAAGTLLAAFSQHWIQLFFAIAMLRLFGQGISSMLGTTSAAKWFPQDQSKAVSVAGLGFPLGEAILPAIVLMMFDLLGSTTTGVIFALVAPLVVLPTSLLLLGKRAPESETEKGQSDKSKAAKNRRSSMYKDKRFFLMLLLTSPLPFFSTGIIFFQTKLVEDFNWPAKAFASGFLCFAIIRATFSLGIGALADKIGPVRLLGSPLLIFACGLLLIQIPTHWIVYPAFGMLGFAFGVSGSITTPIWGQLFGLDRLGEARGASASITVFATAASPALFGYLYDFGLGSQYILLASAIILASCWPFSLLVKRIIRQSEEIA